MLQGRAGVAAPTARPRPGLAAFRGQRPVLRFGLDHAGEGDSDGFPVSPGRGDGENAGQSPVADDLAGVVPADPPAPGELTDSQRLARRRYSWHGSLAFLQHLRDEITRATERRGGRDDTARRRPEGA